MKILNHFLVSDLKVKIINWLCVLCLSSEAPRSGMQARAVKLSN